MNSLPRPAGIPVAKTKGWVLTNVRQVEERRATTAFDCAAGCGKTVIVHQDPRLSSYEPPESDCPHSDQPSVIEHKPVRVAPAKKVEWNLEKMREGFLAGTLIRDWRCTGCGDVFHEEGHRDKVLGPSPCKHCVAALARGEEPLPIDCSDEYAEMRPRSLGERVQELRDGTYSSELIAAWGCPVCPATAITRGDLRPAPCRHPGRLPPPPEWRPISGTRSENGTRQYECSVCRRIRTAETVPPACNCDPLARTRAARGDSAPARPAFPGEVA